MRLHKLINKVTLLSGGLSSEDYLSRRSASYIYKILSKTDYKIDILDWKKDGEIVQLSKPEGTVINKYNNFIECFSNYKTDIIMNCLHGEMENTGKIQGFFSMINIPITGNQLAPSVVGMDKILTKDLFRRMNILTPKDLYLGSLKDIDVNKTINYINNQGFTFPFVLKTTHGGSSEGVSLIENSNAFKEIVEIWENTPEKKHVPVFIEEYINGKEYCIGLFGHWSNSEIITLPIANIVFNGKIFDKNIKTNNSYSTNFDINLPKVTLDYMKKTGMQLHRFLKFSGFSRIDFILDNNSQLYALEVNTHPGLSSHSIIPSMVNRSNELSMKDSLAQMINWSVDNSIYNTIEGTYQY